MLGEATVALPLEGVIDFAAEKARLSKELEKLAKDMAAIDGRLNNPGFVAKAPPEVLEESRERKAELEARRPRSTRRWAVWVICSRNSSDVSAARGVGSMGPGFCRDDGWGEELRRGRAALGVSERT